MSNRMTEIWSKLKDSPIFWAVVVGLALFIGGYIAGRNHTVPAKIVEKTVEDTQSKQKLAEANQTIVNLQQKLDIANHTIADLQTHVKVVTHYVKAPDGTVTVDTTKESNTSSHTDSNTNVSSNTNSSSSSTSTKTAETETKTHKEAEKTITPVNTKPWFIGPLFVWVPSAPAGQQFDAGVVFGRYLGEIPLLKIPVSASVSLTVPVNKPVSVPAVGGALTFGF